MRWIIRVRRSHPAFARGEIAFLAPANEKMLAYLRIYEGEILLCVVNLCETAQAAGFAFPGQTEFFARYLFRGRRHLKWIDRWSRN